MNLLFVYLTHASLVLLWYKNHSAKLPCKTMAVLSILAWKRWTQLKTKSYISIPIERLEGFTVFADVWSGYRHAILRRNRVTPRNLPSNIKRI